MPSQEEKLCENLTDMLDLVRELVASCYERKCTTINPNLIQTAKVFLMTIDKKYLLEGFIRSSHIYWDKIHLRNEDFFFSNAREVFSELPMENVEAFTILFTAKDKSGKLVVPKEDREAVWDYLHSIVKICIQHIFNERKTDGNYMKEINIQRYINEYNLKIK